MLTYLQKVDLFFFYIYAPPLTTRTTICELTYCLHLTISSTKHEVLLKFLKLFVISYVEIVIKEREQYQYQSISIHSEAERENS